MSTKDRTRGATLSGQVLPRDKKTGDTPIVHLLELVGWSADLQCRTVALDIALGERETRRSALRLLWLGDPNAPAGGRAAFDALMDKVHQVLSSEPNVDLLWRELAAEHEAARDAIVGAFDVTRALRPVPELGTAAWASARMAVPTWLLSIEIARTAAWNDVSGLFQAWSNAVAPIRQESGAYRPPPPQRTNAAAGARDVLEQLLADGKRFADSAEVGRTISGNPDHSNPKMVAGRARKAGELLGVWDGRTYRYPRFQFDSEGQPLPAITALIAALPKDRDEHGVDTGANRDAALWLYTPDETFDGQAPAEVFAARSAEVVALAEARAQGGEDLSAPILDYASSEAENDIEHAMALLVEKLSASARSSVTGFARALRPSLDRRPERHSQTARDAVVTVIGVGEVGGAVVRDVAGGAGDAVRCLVVDIDSSAWSTQSTLENGYEALSLAGATPGGGRGEILRQASDCALAAAKAIGSRIAETDLVVIVAGLGSATGAGAGSMIAALAKAERVLTIGAVAMPLPSDIPSHHDWAEQSLPAWEHNTDALITLSHHEMLTSLGADTATSAEQHMHRLLRQAIDSMVLPLTTPGARRLGMEDMYRFFEGAGRTRFGQGLAKDPAGVLDAIELALQDPLLGQDALGSLLGVWINIGTSSPRAFPELAEDSELVAALKLAEVRVMVGAHVDAALNDTVRATVVLTGVSRTGDTSPPARGSLDLFRAVLRSVRSESSSQVSNGLE